MVKLSRPIVLGIDVLVSKQTVKYKHWLAGIDCLIICFGSSVGRAEVTTLESADQFRPEAAR